MSTAPNAPFSIPFDAVRVWRGFRTPSMSQADFFDRLGTVFVPATVEMQIAVGLDTYVPTIPAGMAGKPDTVPDETAILFWDSQQTYHDGFLTLAVRTYTLTHGAVYTPSSRADFPLSFDGQMSAEQPYYLVPRSADWMKGTVTHLVGGRPSAVTPDQFRANVAGALTAIQQQAELAGAIACAGDDYLVFWALTDGGAEAGRDSAASLAKQCDWSHLFAPQPTSLPCGLWDRWPGMQITSGSSFNMQFKRRWES